MPLAELFRSLAQQMLVPGGIFENVPIIATYTRAEDSDYDPTTGVVTEHQTSYAITGVKDKVDFRKIDNVNVMPNDQLFYAPYQTLREAGLTVPSKPEDTLTILGEVWSVVRAQTDPVDAVLIIQIRRP